MANHRGTASPGSPMKQRGYEYIEHTADLGFKAYGSTLQAMFANAAAALIGVMVDRETVQPKLERALQVGGQDLDTVLVSWLNELLYVFDIEQVFLTQFNFAYISDHGLEAIAKGEAMDPKHHHIKTTIKAVTYHQLYVKERNGLWRCRVFLDL